MESDQLNICQSCIGDRYLRQQISCHGSVAQCDQCEEEGRTVDIEWLADQVREALANHYYYTSPEPDYVPIEMLKEGRWERTGTPLVTVIGDMLEVGEDPVARNVQQNLESRFGDLGLAKIGEEDPFGEEAHYARKHPEHTEYVEAWSELETTLRTESRFFNSRAAEILEVVFAEIEALTSPFGLTAIETGGPECPFASIFRGRTALDEKKLKLILANPERELGAPPKGHASAGRMNAAGVSVFYGADSHETVLAELRPPVGSHVVVSRFQFTRQLKFLKITGFDNIRIEGSDFDPTRLRRLKQAGFLRSLSKLLTKPVRPGDETIEYLVTQVVAEFLSKRFDGLIFSSVQAVNGFNVVLFGSSATVHPIQLPKGAKVEVECTTVTRDGRETEYVVTVELPEGVTSGETKTDPDDSAALMLEQNTLKVHHVEAVTYKTDEYFVSRYSYSGPESDTLEF